MRRFTLLFAALLSFAGMTMKAETADFENALPEGWEAVGTMTYYERPKTGSYSISNSAGSGWDTNRGNYIKTTKLDGDITLWLRSYKSGSTGYVVLFKLSDDGETVGDKLVAFSSSSTTFAEKSYTLTEATRLAIVINYAHLDNMTYEEAVAAEGPALTVKDGSKKLTSPAAFDFGLAVAGTEKTFTLSNPGTEELGVTVSETGNFGATLSSTTIAAGGEATLTVTMPETTGSSAVTITPNAEGIEPFVINVSGTVRDANKIFIDFADGELPADWQTASSSTYYNWTVNEGYISYAGSSSSYSGTLTSPKLVLENGEVIAFETTRYGSSTWYSPSISIQYSIDGTEWTTIQTYTDDVYDTWTPRAVTIPVEGAQYIRFSGWYVSITNIYGGELPQEPKMVVTQPASLDFGVITEATTKTFTIANTGRATLEGINVTSSNDAFAVTGTPASLAAGESAEVTITMAASTTGALSSDITVSATGMDDVQFTVTGVVLPEGLMVVDFNDNQLPAGWTNAASSKWSFSDGKAYCTSAAELVTSKLTVADGDMLVIKATSYDNYDNNYLEAYTSTDGTDWSLVKKFVSRSEIPYGSYATLILTDIPTTAKYIKFKGYYVRIDEIAGLTYDANAPLLAVTPAEDFAAGKVTESVSKTYTVSNDGTGELTVNITSSSEDFTVEPAQLIVTDEPKQFTVTFNYTEGNYGEKSATITVTPTYDETAAVSFSATANAKNPNVWEEDFEEGTLANVWDNEGNWTVSRPSASGSNGTYMATISSYNNPKRLTTPRLEAKAGDVLSFYIGMQYDDEPLTIEYSADDKATWTVIEEGVENYTASADLSFTAPADGYYYVRFTGTYAMLDNFSGFKLALKEHEAVIAESNIPASGSQYVNYTATVTVKELVGKDEEVTAALIVAGEEVATATETVEANGTKQLTLTFVPTEALTDAETKIVVTYAGGTLETDATALTIAPAPTLDEETGSLADFENWGSYPVVTLKYTLKAGWNTIVLPFAVSDMSVFGADAEAYKLDSYTEGTLHFSKVTTMDAQTPYVIYATEAKTELMFTGVTMFRTSTSLDDIYAQNVEGIRFQGTYAPVAAPDMEGKYGVTTSGQISKGSKYASIKGFRAYFELPAEVVGEIKGFSFDGGNADGIREINGLDDLKDARIYNIAGQQLQKAQSGINIINGKKVIIK